MAIDGVCVSNTPYCGPDGWMSLLEETPYEKGSVDQGTVFLESKYREAEML
jgi:hypothetical protein